LPFRFFALVVVGFFGVDGMIGSGIISTGAFFFPREGVARTVVGGGGSGGSGGF
jgi:hypothetical protein